MVIIAIKATKENIYIIFFFEILVSEIVNYTIITFLV